MIGLLKNFHHAYQVNVLIRRIYFSAQSGGWRHWNGLNKWLKHNRKVLHVRSYHDPMCYPSNHTQLARTTWQPVFNYSATQIYICLNYYNYNEKKKGEIQSIYVEFCWRWHIVNNSARYEMVWIVPLLVHLDPVLLSHWEAILQKTMPSCYTLFEHAKRKISLS